MITRYRDGNAGGAGSADALDPVVPIPELDTLTTDVQSAENAQIAQAIKRCWEKESGRYEPYNNRAMTAWDHYHQTWNSAEGKESWQSQNKFPFLLSQVERFTYLLLRVLDVTPNWMELEALVPQHQVYMDIARNYTKFLLEHDSTRFRSKLAEAFRSGLITGQMRSKVVPEKAGIEQLGQDQGAVPDILGQFRQVIGDGADKPFVPNPDIPKIRIENMPASDVLLDSTGNRRYQMWQQTVPVGLLIDQAADRGFDIDALTRAAHKGVGSSLQVEQYSEAIERNLGTDGLPNCDLLLTFFEGTLPHHEKGDLIFKNKLCILAGDEVIYPPTDMPWWDGDFAIVAAPFIPVPHCVYGKSLLVESIDSFYTENEILNLLIDYCKVAVYGVWEQDEDRINPDQLRFDSKIFPGEVRNVIGTASPGAPATRRIQIPAIGADFAQFWQIFSSSLENTTGGANQLGGASRARGRITGEEFRSRQADSGALIQGWFEEIERAFITPLVRLVFLRGLQSTTDEMWKAWVLTQKNSILPPKEQANPELYANWEEAINMCAEWGSKERWQKLGSFFRVKVKIFSALAERQMMLEQVIFLLKNAAQFGATQFLRMDVLFQYLVRAMGFDPEKVMNLAAIPLPVVNPEDTAVSNGFGEFSSTGEAASSEGAGLDLSGGLFDILYPQNTQPQQPPPQPGRPVNPQRMAGPFPGGAQSPVANPPRDVWNGG